MFYKNMLFRYIANPNYLEFIYLKGLFLLKNIYILLHFNTVNRNEITSILEKAYIYFIEFVIQININSANFELTLKDAVMFTYKKTIFSYKQTSTNKNIINHYIDNNLNSICNIFYIVNNVNFIDCSSFNDANEEECIHTLITNKINAIKTLEIKLLKLIQHNINLQQLNNDLIDLRTNMEKTIDATANANNATMLNTIVTLLDKAITE
jgi:hypothetical protein